MGWVDLLVLRGADRAEIARSPLPALCDRIADLQYALAVERADAVAYTPERDRPAEQARMARSDDDLERIAAEILERRARRR